MDKCINEDIGRLITFYEMGLLGEKDRTRFEDHALECGYCLHELQRLNSGLKILFEHKQEVLENLQARGITFEGAQENLLRLAAKKEVPAESLWEKFYNSIRSNWFPKAGIPALAVAAAIVLILVLPKSRHPDNPYYKYLSFEKAPYLSLGDTRVKETEAHRFFSEGMQLYQKNDFQAVINNLEKAVQIDSSEGKFWLYLGISYYLKRRSEPAIAALIKAGQKLDTVQRNRALWYLAQAYLLDGDVESSVPILQSLSNQQLEYAKEANNLLKEIREISPEMFKN